MSKRSAVVLGMAILCGLVLVRAAVAESITTIDWWVVSGGGGESSGSSVTLNDTMGQPVIGPSSNGNISLHAGYWQTVLGPTAVDLVFFIAQPQVGGILISWETANELDLLGFNLYRASSPDEGWELLNGKLIAAQKPGSMQGALYQYLDETAKAGIKYRYWLEAVEIGGSSQYAPISATWFYQLYLPLIDRE